MTTNKTIYDYQGVLATIQAIDHKAHIAGGAVRDTLLGKAIHDVDIFAPDDIVDEAARRLRSDHAYVKVGEWKEYLGFSDPAMLRVAKFEKADETIPICLIGLKPAFTRPAENIARFDFGLCMVAFDGATTFQTSEFDHDVGAKTFTLLRADNRAQFVYSMSRYEKITARRYAGWSLSIHGDFEEFARERALGREFYRDFVKGFDGEFILKPKDRPIVTLSS